MVTGETRQRYRGGEEDPALGWRRGRPVGRTDRPSDASEFSNSGPRPLSHIGHPADCERMSHNPSAGFPGGLCAYVPDSCRSSEYQSSTVRDHELDTRRRGGARPSSSFCRRKATSLVDRGVLGGETVLTGADSEDKYGHDNHQEEEAQRRVNPVIEDDAPHFG